MKFHQNPFHADGQTDGGTDRTKLKVTFRNSANAPEDPFCFKDIHWRRVECMTLFTN